MLHKYFWTNQIFDLSAWICPYFCLFPYIICHIIQRWVSSGGVNNFLNIFYRSSLKNCWKWDGYTWTIHVIQAISLPRCTQLHLPKYHKVCCSIVYCGVLVSCNLQLKVKPMDFTRSTYAEFMSAVSVYNS